MRLSFYSGLALAMIAADTAKAEDGASRKETSLAQAANERTDEEQDGDWALAQSESKADVYSDMEAAVTADTGSEIDNSIQADSEADVWTDAEIDSEADLHAESEIGSESDVYAESDIESDIESDVDIDLESENESPEVVLT